mmetsp:Transcript_22821/g.73150  ORF Transcript_22821/g.73150 Transcript_22821/m.73150 type:complete len:345 (-) Transcript_22821:677-1711(-)
MPLARWRTKTSVSSCVLLPPTRPPPGSLPSTRAVPSFSRTRGLAVAPTGRPSSKSKRTRRLQQPRWLLLVQQHPWAASATTTLSAAAHLAPARSHTPLARRRCAARSPRATTSRPRRSSLPLPPEASKARLPSKIALWAPTPTTRPGGVTTTTASSPATKVTRTTASRFAPRVAATMSKAKAAAAVTTTTMMTTTTTTTTTTTRPTTRMGRLSAATKAVRRATSSAFAEARAQPATPQSSASRLAPPCHGKCGCSLTSASYQCEAQTTSQTAKSSQRQSRSSASSQSTFSEQRAASTTLPASPQTGCRTPSTAATSCHSSSSCTSKSRAHHSTQWCSTLPPRTG